MRALTCISHQFSTAPGDMPVISGVLGPQRQNIASVMAHLLGPVVGRTAWHLTRLATKSGERCRLTHFAVIFYCVVVLCVFSGCSNFSTLQSARTLPESSYRMFVGGGGFFGNQANPAIHDITGGVVQSYSSFFLELGGRIGLVRYLDMGAKLTFPGTALVDLKFQFLDWGMMAMGVGAGFGYMYMRGTTSQNITLVSHLFDGTIPMYLSFDFLEWLGLYVSARWVYRIQTGSISSETKYKGASVGIRLGNTIGVLLEGTYLEQVDFSYKGYQFGGAFFWGSAPSANYYMKGKSYEESRKWGTREKGQGEVPEGQLRAHVLEVGPGYRSAVVSHEALGGWKTGEKLCIMKGRIKAACGVVVGVNSDGAQMKISGRRGRITPGMLVVRE